MMLLRQHFLRISFAMFYGYRIYCLCSCCKFAKQYYALAGIRNQGNICVYKHCIDTLYTYIRLRMTLQALAMLLLRLLATFRIVEFIISSATSMVSRQVTAQRRWESSKMRCQFSFTKKKNTGSSYFFSAWGFIQALILQMEANNDAEFCCFFMIIFERNRLFMHFFFFAFV